LQEARRKIKNEKLKTCLPAGKVKNDRVLVFLKVMAVDCFSKIG